MNWWLFWQWKYTASEPPDPLSLSCFQISTAPIIRKPQTSLIYAIVYLHIHCVCPFIHIQATQWFLLSICITVHCLIIELWYIFHSIRISHNGGSDLFCLMVLKLKQRSEVYTKQNCVILMFTLTYSVCQVSSQLLIVMPKWSVIISPSSQNCSWITNISYYENTISLATMSMYHGSFFHFHESSQISFICNSL